MGWGRCTHEQVANSPEAIPNGACPYPVERLGSWREREIYIYIERGKREGGEGGGGGKRDRERERKEKER